MPITFHIPAALREFTAGQSSVAIEGPPSTVADALSILWTRYPGVRNRVANEQGQVRQHINIFVGNENIRYTGGLATLVSDGATISIVPAVSGGMIGAHRIQATDFIADRPERASRSSEFAEKHDHLSQTKLPHSRSQ